jgi:TonB family protein
MNLRKSLIIVMSTLTISTCFAQTPTRGHTSEATLRRIATKTILPSFPDDAARDNKTGVAVSEIQIDTGGHVSVVKVLEAPSPSIAESVSTALQKWEFRPLLDSDRKPVLLSGKITFYFEKVSGVPHVYDPIAIGYVGRWQNQPTSSAHDKSTRPNGHS